MSSGHFLCSKSSVFLIVFNGFRVKGQNCLGTTVYWVSSIVCLYSSSNFSNGSTAQSLIGIWVKQTTVDFCLLDIFWDLGERSGADRGGVEQRRSFILLKLTGAGGGPKLERALRELYNVHLRPLFHQNCPRSWSCH